jgi:metallophosphoesterase superfamily enzyme
MDTATSYVPSYCTEGAVRPLFTWTHLSDIHVGHGSAGHRMDQQEVLKNLVADLTRVPQPFQQVDAVFITGDIAFSGSVRDSGGHREYDEAMRFVEKVCEVLGLEKHQVYVVPGNHDVQRERQDDPVRAQPVGAREHAPRAGAALAALSMVPRCRALSRSSRRRAGSSARRP